MPKLEGPARAGRSPSLWVFKLLRRALRHQPISQEPSRHPAILKYSRTPSTMTPKPSRRLTWVSTAPGSAPEEGPSPGRPAIPPTGSQPFESSHRLWSATCRQTAPARSRRQRPSPGKRLRRRSRWLGGGASRCDIFVGGWGVRDQVSQADHPDDSGPARAPGVRRSRRRTRATPPFTPGLHLVYTMDPLRSRPIPWCGPDSHPLHIGLGETAKPRTCRAGRPTSVLCCVVVQQCSSTKP
jgi:hypothetical protein